MKIHAFRRSNKRALTKTKDVPLELRSPPTKHPKNKDAVDEEVTDSPPGTCWAQWSDNSDNDTDGETPPDDDAVVNKDNTQRLGDEGAALRDHEDACGHEDAQGDEHTAPCDQQAPGEENSTDAHSPVLTQAEINVTKLTPASASIDSI